MYKLIFIKTAFDQYWNNLINVIPTYIFLMLLGTFCLGIVLIIILKGVRNGFQNISRLVLFEITFIIYCSTVIYRNSIDLLKYNFHPFWSYAAIKDGKVDLLDENIMNVFVFLPVGLLLGVGFPKWPWWKAIGLGCLISISIELLQFILKRGFSEVDDVIHNSLGCIFGFLFVKMLYFFYSVFVKLR